MYIAFSFLSRLRGGYVLHYSARVPAALARTFKTFAACFMALVMHE